MKNIAAYLDAQASKSGVAKDANTQQLGKTIYRAGIAEKVCQLMPAATVLMAQASLISFRVSVASIRAIRQRS